MSSMKVAACILTLAFAVSTPAPAQNNPVITAVKDILPHSQENLVGAAEEMPQDKYGFKPTAQQMTFAHLIGHIAGSNNLLCASLSGQPSPPKPPETEQKDELVKAIKQSFDFCSNALGKIDDSQLNDKVKVFGGREVTKARALFMLTNDWADHYGAAAVYLRLSGLLPPSAKGK
jgi:uncharacterized damage-inducible protein DinB